MLLQLDYNLPRNQPIFTRNNKLTCSLCNPIHNPSSSFLHTRGESGKRKREKKAGQNETLRELRYTTTATICNIYKLLVVCDVCNCGH